MHYQEFVNDAYMMGVNLQKLSKNEIKQNPQSIEWRHYYYLFYEAAANYC